MTTSPTKALVIDDEPQIVRALTTNLRVRGYDVASAYTGEDGLIAAAQQRPDIVILDLGLPGIDGIDVVRGLRGWTTVPIVVLSVRDGERDKVAALDAGADDFVTKPFGMDELFARLRAALRRASPVAEDAVVETDHFSIDLAARRVTSDDEEVRLTPTEWNLLEMLVRHPGKLVTQRELLQEIWGLNTRSKPTTSASTWRVCAPSWNRPPVDRSTSSPSQASDTASSQLTPPDRHNRAAAHSSTSTTREPKAGTERRERSRT